MDFIGWTVWTEFMYADEGWLTSLGFGDPDEFDPEEDAFPKLFGILRDFLKESGAINQLGGCFHFSSNMGRVISDANVFEIYPKYLKAMEVFQKELPLEIGLHSQFSFDLNPLGKGYHKAFLEDLEIAKAIKASTIVAHPPYNSSWDREQFMELFIKEITSPDLLKPFAESNIFIAWENMIEGQYSSLKELIRFREHLGDKLSDLGYPELINRHVFCFDTGHLLIWEHTHHRPSVLQDEIEEYLPRFGKLLKAYHIHANDGKTDNHIHPDSLEFFNHQTRAKIKKEKFLENSKEVWDWIGICEKNKSLDNRHIHSESSKIPFSMNQVIEFGRKYMKLFG